MTEHTDETISPVPHTVNGSDVLTEADVLAYLVGAGYETEAPALLTEAARFPCTYKYTQAAIEAGPSAPKRLADGNRKLRAENDRIRDQLQAARKIAEDAMATGLIDGSVLLDLLEGA